MKEARTMTESAEVKEVKRSIKAFKVSDLTQLRNLHGKTLDEAAHQAGISKSYMHYLEQGQRRLSLEMANKLAKIYSVDLDTINVLYLKKKKAKK